MVGLAERIGVSDYVRAELCLYPPIHDAIEADPYNPALRSFLRDLDLPTL